MTDQPAPEPKVARRKWWLAALLQILGIGAGLLYVGRPRRFFVLLACLVVFLVGILHGFWGGLANVWVYLAFVAIIILISLYFLIDAVRLAVRQTDYQLQWYNRWWIYAACIIIPGLLAELGGERWYKEHAAVRSFSAPSGSMSPALHVGDHFLANTALYRERDPQPGDVAVFRLPANPSVDFVKRVVAGPGDRIQITGGVVLLNGVALEQSQIDDFAFSEQMKATQFLERMPNGNEYRTLSLNSSAPGDNTKEYQVPDGHYFVLGDNRDNSTDSRFPHVGFVPRDNFRGKVTGVYWASDLSRIGNLPQQ